MKTFGYWVKAALGDVLLVGLAVLWKHYGAQGAGDVLIFFLWVATVLRGLIGLMPRSAYPDLVEKVPTRPRFFGTYHGITETLTIAFIVWHGFVGLAVCYTISLLLYEATREGVMKLKAAQ